MADNTPPGVNGEQLRGETQKVKDHLKAAGSAAADAIRENAGAAAQAARERARGAGKWARSRFQDLQGRVEERPHTAALWALGIGVVAGILLSSLFRSGRED
jgi:ElaB/YqjD/DUF883 family membrane-anchored ribosome-binding protein